MDRLIIMLATLNLFVFNIAINVQAQVNTKPGFEVASVKPDTSGNIQLRVKPGGRLAVAPVVWTASQRN